MGDLEIEMDSMYCGKIVDEDAYDSAIVWRIV